MSKAKKNPASDIVPYVVVGAGVVGVISLFWYFGSKSASAAGGQLPAATTWALATSLSPGGTYALSMATVAGVTLSAVITALQTSIGALSSGGVGIAQVESWDVGVVPGPNSNPATPSWPTQDTAVKTNWKILFTYTGAQTITLASIGVSVGTIWEKRTV